MGRRQDPRKLAKSRGAKEPIPVCRPSTIFEIGESDTWNISITEREECVGTTEQERGDHERASDPLPSANGDSKPSEESTISPGPKAGWQAVVGSTWKADRSTPELAIGNSCI
jgi:hypothetical protein